MKISTKTKDCRLLVKVKVTGREAIEEKELDRFTRAYLRCFLKPKLVKRNVLEYTGPVGIPLKERFRKEVTKRDFLFILEHIVVAIQKLRGNQFPICNFNMDMQYIYINETTKELQFLYVPLVSQQEPGNVIALLNSVIYLARPAPEKDMDYISRFAYFFKALHPFDIDRIEQFILQEDRNVVNIIKKHNAGQSGFMTSDHKHYHDHMDAQKTAQEEPGSHTRITGGLSGRPAGTEATSIPGEGKADTPASYGSAADTRGQDDATGLLSEYGESVGPAASYEGGGAYFSPYEETARHPAAYDNSANGQDDATGLLSEYNEAVTPSYEGGGAYFTPYEETARHPAAYDNSANGQDDATGLLSEFNETPVPAYEGGGRYFSPYEEPAGQPAVREETPRPPAYELVTVAKPEAEPGLFLDNEAPTGLLTQNGTSLGYYAELSDSGDSGAEETGLLMEEPSHPTPRNVVYPELFRVNTGEKVPVHKAVFRVGKERSNVDYCVSDNSAVSRSHADIITRDIGYFVIDLNSKNRTYVNNQAIPPQTETAIRNGDLLRLANEEFIFRVSNSQGAVATACPGCNAKIEPGAKFCHNCGRRIQN